MSATATLENQTATAEKPSTQEAAATADPAAGCPKCGNLDSWGTASWCPKCGYYPRLGTMVGGDPATEGTETHASPSSYREALARLPRWSYVLAAGVVAIFFVSLAVRVVTPDDSFSRSLWSVLQLFVGGGTFVVVHFYAFLRAGMKTDGFSAFDVIVHPIEVWRPSFRELPGTARRIYAGVWGFTAALCAILIIGGIRYSVLTDDWGFKERPKQNLMKKIKEQMLAAAKEGEEGADNLNDAINDFAGDDKKKEEEHELEMLSADCVVIGYNIDNETGAVKELVLATIVDEKLQYAGTISSGIPEEVQEALTAKLPKLAQEQPFLKCPVSAKWVKPVVTCRTSFKSWSENKRMQQPEFKELLADTDVK
ncbi:MAG TPA: hypothetical protein VL475_04575 [Planctomycetaceae bacterium]|nr:hypothetical protein [Planctomycetaceae bacterium]